MPTASPTGAPPAAPCRSGPAPARPLRRPSAGRATTDGRVVDPLRRAVLIVRAEQAANSAALRPDDQVVLERADRAGATRPRIGRSPPRRSGRLRSETGG